jgi:hypothetical protein
LAHGLKTIEIRTWPTRQRGRVLIHAARVPDERTEAWQLVPPALADLVQLRGGIIGAGDLTGCIAYRSPAAFAVDRPRHLNDPSWFRGRLMYGFTFANLTVDFFTVHPYHGRRTNFLTVIRHETGLLVCSVFNLGATQGRQLPPPVKAKPGVL